jgi:hypothetical protein
VSATTIPAAVDVDGLAFTEPIDISLFLKETPR